MVDKYTITENADITIVTFTVAPTYEDIIEVLDILLEKDMYEKRLFDCTNVNFDISSDNLRALAEYGTRVFTKPNKGAMVAANDLSYGEGRQFSVYREEDNCKFAVFRRKEEAISWLISD